tara:strand:+ start:132 stop:410 length:279 start_codon:yes stop_codon:yes gene_type:complete
MKHFSIAYVDQKNDSFEICEYAENADEAVNHAMEDIPLLKGHKEYIYRCTNESALDWLQKNNIKEDLFNKENNLNKDKKSLFDYLGFFFKKF